MIGRRVGDTNGNNQAALPPFFVCIARGRACTVFNLARRSCRRQGNGQQLKRVRIAIERT
jgi:hypothetical protein